MKVLFITGSLNQGGAEFQLLAHAKLFQDKGNDVEVFALTDYSFYKDYVESNNLSYDHLYNDQSKTKRVWLTTQKIKSFQPDIIISYLKAVSQVALVARLLSGSKAKLIVGERTSLIRPRHDQFYFNFVRLSDAITINSISKLNYVKEKFSHLVNKLHFFPNVVDVSKFTFSKELHQRSVKKIAFVGRIAKEKNVHNLVLAFKEVLKNGFDVELLLYGDARDQEYLKKVEAAIDDNLSIKLMGKTNNVAKVYQEIDLLCLLSDYEGFSNVLSEALCHGLPIVTSNIEENEYLVKDKENGFLVKPKNVESIANGILQYLKLESKEEIDMRIRNRKRAEMLFDQDALYDKYLKLIRSL